MANCLTMATIDTILTLHKSGHSNREIARQTGDPRETVGKHIAARGSENWPNPPTGSEAGSPGPRRACQVHHELIVAKLAAGLSTQRIYQDLVSEAVFTASYWSVRRYVAQLTNDIRCHSAGSKRRRARKRKSTSARTPRS